ncbi:MAG TPA: AAA family ATPase [Mycobacteriales bacterium]|nr:AAA family ATPase [Mycobacteriales bacterium]
MSAPLVDGWAAAVETHTAALYFAGDHVLKVKKPVSLGFLDFSSIEARRAACADEVRLNRRLAPDVYLGVSDIVVDGAAVEHGVLMRRLPLDRSLSALVARGVPSLADDVIRLARLFAAFHEHAPVVGRDVAVDIWTHPGQLWRDNVAQASALSPDELPTEDLDAAEWLAQRYVEGRSALFRDRLSAGLVREGHGDLLADDVFLLADEPRVLDCLEFDQRLRVADVLLDVASLVMDLERLGRPDLGRLFMDKYAAEAGENHPTTLEHFYIAHRALVRAKVAAIRAQQLNVTTRVPRDLLAMCIRHLQSAQVRLVVVGGLPGAGKSTMSALLAGRLPATVVSSDAVRWELAPTGGPAAYGAGRYSPAVTNRVYDEMMRRAADRLAHGEHVVLDATFATDAHRAAAREVARRHAADLTEMCVVVDDATAAQRIAERARGLGRSEADVDVRNRLRAQFAPWPEASVVDTDADGAAGVVGAVAAACGAPRSWPE